jgi:predicted site-specific integrase-resolvase
MISDGGVTVLRVTREDRQARFGLGRTRRLFAVHGVPLEVPHPKKAGRRDEPLDNVGLLTTTVAGRSYGLRSARARERLLAEAGPGGADRAE